MSALLVLNCYITVSSSSDLVQCSVRFSLVQLMPLHVIVCSKMSHGIFNHVIFTNTVQSICFAFQDLAFLRSKILSYVLDGFLPLSCGSDVSIIPSQKHLIESMLSLALHLKNEVNHTWFSTWCLNLSLITTICLSMEQYPHVCGQFSNTVSSLHLEVICQC